MKPGDLVQIKRDVLGQGDVGVAVGWVSHHYGDGWNVDVLEVLFSDGIRQIHPHQPSEGGRQDPTQGVSVQPPAHHGIVYSQRKEEGMPETTNLLETALENEAGLFLKMINELQNDDLYEFIRRISELKVQANGTTSTNEILHIAQNVKCIEEALDNFYVA